MLTDANPTEFVGTIRVALSAFAANLREAGATVELDDYCTRDSATLAVTIALPCSTAHSLSVSAAVKDFARTTGARMQDDPLGGDISGTHDVEYRAVLVYSVTKPRARMARRRAAA